uniref:hypothetical protein n=1 Tax=Ndongobacter massiliensis TaxID=1871025 RepID=UPI000A52B2B3|nr:hypothetical protein [Ndongobacter massiliensis]
MEPITTTFRAVPELLEKLDEAAKRLGLTRNALIVNILWRYVGAQPQEKVQE